MIECILAADFMDSKRKREDRERLNLKEDTKLYSTWYLKQKKQMREGKW